MWPYLCFCRPLQPGETLPVRTHRIVSEHLPDAVEPEDKKKHRRKDSKKDKKKKKEDRKDEKEKVNIWVECLRMTFIVPDFILIVSLRYMNNSQHACLVELFIFSLFSSLHSLTGRMLLKSCRTKYSLNAISLSYTNLHMLTIVISSRLKFFFIFQCYVTITEKAQKEV